MKTVQRFFLILLIACSSQVYAQTVFTTKTGEKYHLEKCHYLKYSKKAVTIEDAISRGYEPCSICKPTAKKVSKNTSGLSLDANSGETTPMKKTIATQCTGKTQAGARCKRKTKNSNGRCYQH